MKTYRFLLFDADGTLLPAGEVGNLKLIAEWIRSGRKAPYYYRFDVTMPGDDAGAFHSAVGQTGTGRMHQTGTGGGQVPGFPGGDRVNWGTGKNQPGIF